MKLAASLKLKVEFALGPYARALRTIGQDLTNLFPQDLEIELQANVFVARGHCSAKRVEGKQPSDKNSGLMLYIDKLLRRDVQKIFSNSEPEIIEFSRTYAPEDIDRLYILA